MVEGALSRELSTTGELQVETRADSPVYGRLNFGVNPYKTEGGRVEPDAATSRTLPGGYPGLDSAHAHTVRHAATRSTPTRAR